MFLLINKIFKIWFSIKEPIRFILLGGYNTVLGYLIFIVLNYYLEEYIPYLLVLLISYIIGILNNFILFKIFVFQTKGYWLKECINTYISYIGIYCLNAGLLAILVSLLKLSTYLSQGICTVVIPIFSYFILKYFSFSKKVDKKDKENKEANLPK